MKLLITTQKVDKDDPILGFFHAWIIEFAQRFESVTVICLEEGHHDLPKNVKVLSLGKEERQSRVQYLIHFYWYIIHERKNYDAVFVHMNQIYVILGGILWKILGKKIYLWYAHRAVTFRLRIAVLFSDNIFTSVPQAFGLATRKLHVVGNGIEIDNFARLRGKANQGNILKENTNQKNIDAKNTHKKLSLISIGRITRIKNLDILVRAAALLKEQGVDFVCTMLGPVVTEDDRVYYGELQKIVADEGLADRLLFIDAVPHEKLPDYLWKSDIHVNLAPTGAVDKVVLEAIAAGVIPLASNTSFAAIFGPYAPRLMFTQNDPHSLAEKIQKIYNVKNSSPKAAAEVDAMMENLLRKVEIDFSLSHVIGRICEVIISPRSA